MAVKVATSKVETVVRVLSFSPAWRSKIAARCPTSFRPVAFLPLLWRRRRVRCENSGLQTICASRISEGRVPCFSSFASGQKEYSAWGYFGLAATLVGIAVGLALSR